MNQQSKSYLVTGAAGFIGFQAALDLLNEGHQVVGVDNLNDYYSPKLKHFRLEKLQSFDAFHFFEGNIADMPFMSQVFKDHHFDAVFNLAAQAGVRYSIENPFVYHESNTLGVLNILELMKTQEVSKLLLASTSSLYSGLPGPFEESAAVNTPISPYAASKKAAEVMTYTYHHLYKFDVAIFRYFTVFGPYGRPDMAIFRFIESILRKTPIVLFGDGTQARDFTYVGDISRGTIAGLTHQGHDVINLGGGNNPISINTLISTLEEMLGEKAQVDRRQFHQADMEVTWANIDKAKKVLDWAPQISFVKGLEQTVQWHLDNREFLQTIEL